jgi:RNA-binding protein
MELTPRQRGQLKSLAHHLKPIHHIGKEGITEQGLKAISEAFTHRELLKVKVQEAAPLTAAEAGAAIPVELPGVHHVQTIGRTVVLYRPHPEKPEIVLR